MLAQAPETRVRYVALGPRDLLGESERRPFPPAEEGAIPVGVQGVELLRGNSCLHADGVTDVPSVRCSMQARNVQLQERPELGIDCTEPLDGAVEGADAQHQSDAVRHYSFGRRD